MDINYNSVSLLLLGNGAAGSTTITDNSPSPVTVTATGSAQISTAQSKWGGASMLLTGGSLTTSAYAGLGFGTGDFTIEFWLRRSNNNEQITLASITHSGKVTSIALDCPGGGGPAGIKYQNAATNILTSAYSIVMDTWTHIAFVRSSGVLNTYIGGVGKTGVAFTSDLHATGSLVFGDTLTGYIDDLRITKGVARYTSNFIAPIAEFDTAAPSFAEITAPMPVLVFTASPTMNHVSADLAPPRPAVSACSGAVMAITCPSPTLYVAAGANSSLAAPSPTLHFTAHDSTGENAITARAPSPRVTFYTGAVAKAKAPSPTLSITGTVTGWAKVSIQSPNPKVIATATVSGMMSSAIRAPSPNLVGYGGAVCSVTLTGRPTVQATATTGSVASIAVTCPLFQVEASATAQNYGSLHVIAPSPRMGNTIQAWVIAPMAKVTCIGSAVVTATYEAYAINLNHVPVRGVDPVDEVTRYTNFPFTHVVRYKNSYYGANSTGLYLLEGTTDNGTPIPWAFETAMTDFKSPNKKTLAAAYFSGRFGTSSTIQLKKGEKSPITHAFTTPRGTLAQNHRQVFGKDRAETRTRYFALAASGTSEFELDAIECDVHNTTRRI